MQERINRRWNEAIAVALMTVLALAAAGAAQAQPTDFCGCAGSPNSLGAFASNTPATYPAGTDPAPINNFFASCEDAIRIPLPPDGVMVFDSNRLYVVKPIGQRFWTQTAAMNDADEIAGTILMRTLKEDA